MPRMLDFRERNRLRKAIYAKPTILIVALGFFFVAHSAWGMYQKSRDAGDKRDAALERLTELEARERELSSDIARLSTNRGVEEEIRDRFMVAKDGEKVIIVSDPEEEKVHTVTVGDEGDGSIVDRMMNAVGFSGE